MDELLTMSKKELTRLQIMQKLDEKRMTQKEAAEILEGGKMAFIQRKEKYGF